MSIPTLTLSEISQLREALYSLEEENDSWGIDEDEREALEKKLNSMEAAILARQPKTRTTPNPCCNMDPRHGECD